MPMSSKGEITVEFGNRMVIGSCNVCLSRDTEHVWIMTFLSPDRKGSEVRLCYQCMEDFKKMINKLDKYKYD